MNVAGSTMSSSVKTSADSYTSSQEAKVSDETVANAASTTGVATVVGILPGLGDYTDSEHSDTSSSDSDIDTDLFKREPQSKPGQESTAASSTVKHRHH